MRASMLLFTLLFATSATADEVWNCRNPDIEVGCDSEKCTALGRGDFTPMSVAFTKEGYISACMYSGCWEGEGRATDSGRFLAILASNLIWSTDPEPGSRRQDVAILFDRNDRVAMLKAGDYAQPLLCTLLVPQR